MDGILNLWMILDKENEPVACTNTENTDMLRRFVCFFRVVSGPHNLAPWSPVVEFSNNFFLVKIEFSNHILPCHCHWYETVLRQICSLLFSESSKALRKK